MRLNNFSLDICLTLDESDSWALSSLEKVAMDHITCPSAFAAMR